MSIPEAKPVKQELDSWLADEWRPLTATSVEPYQPNAREQHPSFVVKLKNGKTLRFDKLLESPELQIARPDEGMIYHFPQDTGFVILNPPIGYRPK
ncbi:MAG: hypothetical protein FGM62_06055 [Methylobacterium sp.]|nr:hypothetical protein [Methylobacterium sp.]